MTDFRALCAELHAAFNTYAVNEEHHRLLVRTAAALAQPEPQGPTDEELHQLWQELYIFHDGPTSGEVTEIARAVLARWGS
jgi:hypothetical protein